MTLENLDSKLVLASPCVIPLSSSFVSPFSSPFRVLVMSSLAVYLLTKQEISASKIAWLMYHQHQSVSKGISLLQSRCLV